jgi:hypothetical protein
MLEKDLKIKSTNKQRRKLVDYFNQRWEEKFWEKWYFKYTMRFDNVHIISKNMWFIDRLVKNNKIDYEKCIKEFMLKDFGKFFYMSKNDVVIANLSIQDNPISLLLDYLK